MSESNRIGPDTERRPPLLCNSLGQALDTGLGERVVGLSRIAVKTRRRRYVDDVAGLTILDTEVWRR